MIEKLKATTGSAIGFSMIGKLSSEDVAQFSQEIELAMAAHKRPLGVLADLTRMEGASWDARWHEMRFLQHHTNDIARMAIICDDPWQQVSEMVLVATAVLQAETLYFHSSEILHAWHWVKMNKLDESMPVRMIYPGKGLFQNYTPEYMGI
ncbi:SpoIIAA-like [Granulicella pectinivorans]|jgi:hypothetical protein|uniref:SpoIIAA-like n=1 Tax=Granulicella pectinivorans TaxID=474950 RepID=A0A1I6MRQ8_9BACT|nr:STAS/SEC14 domain-containing protein [Granulicella pectinivorans]SFS18198.1 SpoIIAA-like [Granulicella pectinivorans]